MITAGSVHVDTYLNDTLRTYFNISELEDIAFDLHIREGEINFKTNVNEAALRLVYYCKRNALTAKLWNEVAKHRPALNMKEWVGPVQVSGADREKPSPGELIEQAESLMFQAIDLIAQAKAQL